MVIGIELPAGSDMGAAPEEEFVEPDDVLATPIKEDGVKSGPEVFTGIDIESFADGLQLTEILPAVPPLAV